MSSPEVSERYQDSGSNYSEVIQRPHAMLICLKFALYLTDRVVESCQKFLITKFGLGSLFALKLNPVY